MRGSQKLRQGLQKLRPKFKAGQSIFETAEEKEKQKIEEAKLARRGIFEPKPQNMGQKYLLIFLSSKRPGEAERLLQVVVQWWPATKMGIQIVRNINIIYNQIKSNPSMSSPFQAIKKRVNEEAKNDPKFAELELSDINIGRFTPEINALLEKHKEIEVLYLKNCGLTTLEGFPNLPKLGGIDLENNKIDDQSLQVLTRFPELSQIILNDNKVEKLESVLKLASLTKLLEIDFEGNPVSKLADYSKSVFEKFPAIEFVDRKDKEGNEQPQEDDEEFNEDDEEEEYDGDEQEYDEDEEDFEEEDEESEDQPKKGRKKK